MRSICSSPRPVAVKAAVCYHVEKYKIAMIGQALKVLNQPHLFFLFLLVIFLDTPLYCASEEGVMNLQRSQRRYLLRSTEQSMQRAHSVVAYVRKASKEQVTPASPSTRRARHDPHLYALPSSSGTSRQPTQVQMYVLSILLVLLLSDN